MKKNLYCTVTYLIFLQLIIKVAYTQNPPCLQGIINKYTSVVQICELNTLYTSNTTEFNNNEKILIYQAQGASIDTTNTQNFGNIINYNGAGNYEINYIQSINNNVITLKYALTQNYNVQGKVQIVSIPNLQNANVCNLTCKSWDGETGGILIFDADTLNLQGSIDVSGKGFRGGKASIKNDYKEKYNFYYNYNSGYSAEKGEGINILNTTNNAGAGKNANGGGAGNASNAGGGGGSNANIAGNGGKSSFNNATTLFYGGFGGQKLEQNNNKIYLGGGGGGAHGNEDCTGKGGDGGGILFVTAKKITGNNESIYAIGQNGFDSVLDGAGGGGAGGTVILNCNNINNLLIHANGGNGGNCIPNNYHLCGAAGGGGSGGIIKTTYNNLINYTVHKGIKGTTNGIDYFTDGNNGLDGMLINNLEIQNANVFSLPIINLKIDSIYVNDCIKNITLTITPQPNNSNYQYAINNNPFQTSNVFTIPSTDIYSIQIETPCTIIDTTLHITVPTHSNCNDTLTISTDTTIIYKPDILIPSAFSPNNDGINDKLKVIGNNIIYFNIRIYDRWGKKVFETNNPEIGFDGTYQNQPLPIGAYPYIIIYKINNTFNTKSITGNITLIR